MDSIHPIIDQCETSFILSHVITQQTQFNVVPKARYGHWKEYSVRGSNFYLGKVV